MKKTATTALLFTLMLFFTNLKAQTAGPLYGLTELGGDSSGGVLFKYDPTTQLDSLVYQFSAYSPLYPNYTYSNIILGTDGNFYGLSGQGGAYDEGTVYKCTPEGRMTVLASFNDTNGYQPRGSLIQALDGNLYGMTDEGGNHGDGVIFRCTTTGVLDMLISFNGINGSDPTTNSLIQATDGNLYGMTQGGGKYNDGVIFKYNILSGIYDTLLSFNYKNGGNPWGSLVEGSDGKLYGMTGYGGKYTDGMIFKCSTTGVLDTLASFNYTNGYIPYGNLIEATDGNFYGMTYAGGSDDEGVFFKYDTTTRTIDTIVSFRGANGEYPISSVMQASDGNIYGATEDGGAKNEGVIFKYSTTTKQFDTLVSFTDGATGKYPISNLIQTGGNFYGLTWEGGASSNGALFQCTTNGVLSIVYNIASTYFGYYAVGSLIRGSDGYLYGTSTASYTNNNGNGTIFRCLPSGADMTTLAVFNGANGLNPDGKLLQASDGNLYGMTHNGGKYGFGVIYKYTLPGGPFDTLVSFNDTNGAFPWGNLIQGYDGNFYGLTSGGGTSYDGTIFQCTIGGVITVFHSFAGGNDGQSPRGSLIQGTDSVLYGLTEEGTGSGQGGFFKCTTSGTYTFLASGIGYPYGSLVQGIDGNLYGLSSEGGNNSEGSLFKATTAGQVTNLVSFTIATGYDPQGTLIQASDSALYGMASYGGKYGDGVVFKYNISTSTYDTLFSFNGANGKAPQFGNLLEWNNIPTGIHQLANENSQVTVYPNPFGNNVAVKINSSVSEVGDWSLMVTDVLGRTVYFMPSLNYTNNIDLSSQPSGTYFITVINKVGKTVLPVVKE